MIYDNAVSCAIEYYGFKLPPPNPSESVEDRNKRMETEVLAWLQDRAGVTKLRDGKILVKSH
jgi:hypothetical protein